MNHEEENFKCDLNFSIVTFKTRRQTVLVKRELLRESFFSIEKAGIGSSLTIITKGPTYSIDIPVSPEDLTSTIFGLISDLT